MWQKLYQHLQQEASLSGWKTSVFTLRNVNHLVLLILAITYCRGCQQAASFLASPKPHILKKEEQGTFYKSAAYRVGVFLKKNTSV